MKNKDNNLKNLILFLLTFALFALSVRIDVIAANTFMDAKAQETSTVLKAAETEEGFFGKNNELVEIRVDGRLEESDRQALLDRLNAIREEACREGVPNPVDGEPLRQEDYVPLEWSANLEKIAILRAVESTILQDHVRPDGTDCFSAAPEGVPFTTETLAWGFGSAAAAIEGWYSEKEAYVGESGTPAGHYMALINPENRFVGIADFQPDWQRDACAGAFASHGTAESDEPVQMTGVEQTAAADQGTEAEPGSAADAASEMMEWSIPLMRSYLPEVMKRAVEVTAKRIINAAHFGRQLWNIN